MIEKKCDNCAYTDVEFEQGISNPCNECNNSFDMHCPDKDEYYSLVAEVERLKQENKQYKQTIESIPPDRIKDYATISKLIQENEQNIKKWRDEFCNNTNKDMEIEELKQENEKLKEVLKACNPWHMLELKCVICGNDIKGHAEDCLYVEFTGKR